MEKTYQPHPTHQRPQNCHIEDLYLKQSTTTIHLNSGKANKNLTSFLFFRFVTPSDWLLRFIMLLRMLFPYRIVEKGRNKFALKHMTLSQ